MKPSSMIAIVFILIQCLYSFANANASVINDSLYSFEIEIPEGWNIKKAKNDSAFCRLVSTSLDNSVSLYIYSGRVDKGFVNLTKLADLGKKSFPFLGNEVNRNKIGANRFEVYYDNENKSATYAKVIYLAKESNYYILVSYSKSMDLSAIDTILSSFRLNSSFSWYAVIYIIGTLSLLFHVIIFHYFAFQFVRNYTQDGFIRKVFLKWNFAWTIPVFLLITYIVFYRIDYLIIGNIFNSYKLYGIEGVAYQLIEIGPKFYELSGEFISEAMSDLIGFGYWPGGKTGVIMSTVVSIILNGLEIYYAIRKNKEWLNV